MQLIPIYTKDTFKTLESEINEQDFENTKPIGRGAFGDVIMMVNKRNPTFIIAKKALILEEFQDSGQTKEQTKKDLENEMEMLKQLSSEQIKPKSFPKYYGSRKEVSKLNSVTYNLYFEYQPHSIKSMIDDQKTLNQPFEFKFVFKYFKTLVNGLAFLQIMNICHRDLKPANILVDESKQNPIIIDFGLSKNVSAKMQEMNTTKITMLIEGTPAYLSPEMQKARKNEVEKERMNPFKSDVFSLGLIIVEMLLLKKPRNTINHVQGDVKKTLLEIQSNEQSIQIEDLPNYSKFYDLISRCLEIDPHIRPDFIVLFLNLFQSPFDRKKIKFHVLIEEEANVQNLPLILSKSICFFLLSIFFKNFCVSRK